MNPHRSNCNAYYSWDLTQCTCGEKERYRTLTEPDGPGSMTVVVTFAGDETVTYNNILVPVEGEPFTYFDDGKRVHFESADIRNSVCYEVFNPLSIATIAE